MEGFGEISGSFFNSNLKLFLAAECGMENGEKVLVRFVFTFLL